MGYLSHASDTETRPDRELSPEAPLAGGPCCEDEGRCPWGQYGPAVHRWERVLGRRAPRPTDDRGRLSPRFVEFLMGLPDGWVTGTEGLSRSQQLKCLGNGVVPQQAVHALELLLSREPMEVAA